ncbi:HD domain-containing protein [Corynebacterium sp. 335C]
MRDDASRPRPVPRPWADDPQLARAWRLAAEAHDGQSRPGAGGEPEPYLRHAERVAAAVARGGHPPHVVAAALLHDVAEDAPEAWSRAAGGFDARVQRIVDAVTRRPGEDYAAHVARAGADGEGRVVKLADLRDNRGSLGNLPRDTRERRARVERLRARYDAALRDLGR